MQNLLNRSQISSTPGMTKLLLKLYPENLGSIRIEIMQQDGVLSARLLTTTAMGKELLDSQLNQLKNAFANANIQMDRIDIAQSLQETDRNKDQNQFGQQFKQQSKQQEHEQDDHEEESEKLSFSDYLINEEV
nr:flagellar hook-length control protein FliK [Ureibacillus chungkukjangi]